MKRLTCIAIDDEPLALDLIVDNINRIAYLELIGQFPSALAALKFLKSHSVDLIFLDIQMPKLTGIELTGYFQKSQMIIFTTAFDHYAVMSYELNAIDYLLKPIDFVRFKVACEKALETHNLRISAKNDSHIIISSEHEKIKIVFDNILYIEGLKDYVKIYCEGVHKPILTRMNLKTIHELLSQDMFSRVHKSYIINIKKVTTLQGRVLKIGKVEIPVGSKYKEFRELFS